jgi:hypothetical protein
MFCDPIASMINSSPSKHTMWRSEPTGNALYNGIISGWAAQCKLLLNARDKALCIWTQAAFRDAVDFGMQTQDSVQCLFLPHGSLNVELQFVNDGLKVPAGKTGCENREEGIQGAGEWVTHVTKLVGNVWGKLLGKRNFCA